MVFTVMDLHQILLLSQRCGQRAIVDGNILHLALGTCKIIQRDCEKWTESSSKKVIVKVLVVHDVVGSYLLAMQFLIDLLRTLLFQLLVFSKEEALSRTITW